jgi:nuclease YhcG-like protein
LIVQDLTTMQDAQRMSPSLVMRDPYILDFLGLRNTWQETDLEAAISREMESFLLELGAGFTLRRPKLGQSVIALTRTDLPAEGVIDEEGVAEDERD